MAVEVLPRPRVRVDGKFFRRGDQKLYIKGVAYGPFAPNADAELSSFASPEQTARDFALIKELGANLLRVYHVPPRWFLDLASQLDLLLLVDVPWYNRQCFLDTKAQRDEIRRTVREAVSACARHPAVFAFSVANEIPPDIVRWSGARAVADFIDGLVAEARRVDPDCLCTFTNFPPTEFLRPLSPDFVCFNVYLHNPQPFKNYLAHLQMVAESKPLLLGEFGVDSLRETEPRKCEMLDWQIEHAFRGGLAGTVIFSFTDEWFKDGRRVEGWEMGLVTAERQPKKSFRVVREKFKVAPHFPLPKTPKVSVVIASYNGDRTLETCLESLEKLNYPDYEVILVDDGSTDTTPQIAKLHPRVRYIRHEENCGLSSARNTGIAAASGEIIAFTDSDCRADEDWLYYLVGDLLDSEFAGIGGPNLLPPEDSAVATAVMASPGGPAHVMLDDRQAEHIPGCNMAFYKHALAQIGGFDPLFRKAGDDVDLCWRLQQAGMKIGFSPAAFVWHYRRSTVSAYLKQQRGYGEAEALLVHKHPEYFNALGGSIWRGRIYGTSLFSVRLQPPVIYHGLFGTGMFQALYSAAPAGTLMLFTMLEYHLFVTLPLWVVTAAFHQALPIAIASTLVSVGICVAAGLQAPLPKNKTRWWSRPLVAWLFLIQPIVRGWERHQNRLRLRPPAETSRESLESVARRDSGERLDEVRYWTEPFIERSEFVKRLITELDVQRWPNRSDIGWSEFDVEIYGSRWSVAHITTVSEEAKRGQIIRCRLRGRWSLQATAAFWALVGLNLLVIGLLRNWSDWVGLLLLTLVPAAWFLHHQKRTLQSVLTVFLDDFAKRTGFIRVSSTTPESSN